MTEPGDTVVIFWNGHGEPIPTTPKATEIEHCLILHDTVDVKLPAKPTEDDVQTAINSLLNSTLSSNLLQRWLQDLDNRRIVFIVEACFSGGLHEKGKAGKSLGAPLLDVEFDAEPFLSGLIR